MPPWSWFVTPSGENLQGFTGVLRWLWDAPLPAHLIGGTLWLLVALAAHALGWFTTLGVVLLVLAVLGVQQGAKWDSVRGYGWREIVPRVLLGCVPLVVWLGWHG